MRAILSVLAFAAACPCLAAETSPVDPAFGNTIVSTYPDGRKAELWLHPDGSYSAEGRGHDPSSGHWKVKDEKLCLKQARPFSFPFSFCTPVIQGGIGTTWTTKAVTGEPIRVQLVKGAAQPAPG